MRVATIAFLVGILIFQQLPTLPDKGWITLLWVSLPLSLWLTPLKIPLWVLNGFLAALVQAQGLMNTALPAELQGQDLLLEGVIDSLPQHKQYGQRFRFKIEAGMDPELSREQLPGLIRLNWYSHEPELAVGQRWQLRVRLKQPHGFLNPGGFDYEGWLFRQGIRATGYVRENGQNRYLGSEQRWAYALDGLRMGLADGIKDALGESDFTGMIQALAVGLRQDISERQWEVLLSTGTNHLMAISGLHVGLVAGLAFFSLRGLWSCSARLLLRWPSAKAGAVAAILAALVYAALAGFSIPTQRALIMVVVFMLALIWQRHRRPLDGLCLALLLVLALDPLAVMDAGFWLSFAAVAVILLGLGGRLGGPSRWWKWGRVHGVIALGLLPLTLLLFQHASLISPLANLVAVPLVSLLVVPLVLLGTLLLNVLPSLGEGLLALAETCLQGLWPVLDTLASLPAARIYGAFVGHWVVLPALIGALWLLAPRGWPARWLGGVWLAAAFLLPHPRPAPGEAQVTVLDVGQGLAAVVQTRHRTLVFDTGPRFSESFDTGEAVVLPYLVSRGIERIDSLIISHGDNDHIGGVESLVQGMPVTRILSSVPEQLAAHDAAKCQAGQVWQWDGVGFEILHPSPAFVGQDNDASCVLKVSTAGGALLLTGDIERRAETALVEQGRAALRADVLVVPHHGSKTSSTPAFIAAVAPRWALIPAGYRNRFKLPRAEVVARYHRAGARVLASGWEGALMLRLGRDGVTPPQGYRRLAPKYWTHFPKQALVVTEK